MDGLAAEPGEVRGAEDLEPEEDLGVREHEGRDAEVGEEDQNGVAREDARSGGEARAAAVDDARLEHEERVGAGDHDDDQSAERIGPDVEDAKSFKHDGDDPCEKKTALPRSPAGR